MNIIKFKKHGRVIQKREFYERVQELYLRHNGKPRYIVEDLEKELGRTVDKTLVYHLVDKIRNGIDLIVVHEAAVNLAPQVLLGLASRQGRIYELLRAFENKEQVNLSACCKMPVEEIPGKTCTTYYCLKCSLETTPIPTTHNDNIHIIRSLIKDLGEEETRTVENIVKLRDGKEVKDPLQILNNQQINVQVHSPGKKRKRKQDELTPESRAAVEAMRHMLPQDRERIIKKIEAQLVDEKLKDMGFLDENGKEIIGGK